MWHRCQVEKRTILRKEAQRRRYHRIHQIFLPASGVTRQLMTSSLSNISSFLTSLARQHLHLHPHCLQSTLQVRIPFVSLQSIDDLSLFLIQQLPAHALLLPEEQQSHQFPLGMNTDNSHLACKSFRDSGRVYSHGFCSSLARTRRFVWNREDDSILDQGFVDFLGIGFRVCDSAKEECALGEITRVF